MLSSCPSKSRTPGHRNVELRKATVVLLASVVDGKTLIDQVDALYFVKAFEWTATEERSQV
jgi:hypothetical protein